MTNLSRQIKASAIALLLMCLDATAGGITISDDLSLGIWSPFVRKWEVRVPVCIWSEDDNGLYRVIGAGLTPGKQFAMTNDLGDRVGYNVFWQTGKNFKRRQKLVSNSPSRGSYPFDPTPECSNGPSAQIRVELNKREIDQAMPGIYDDTLMITLSPL